VSSRDRLFRFRYALLPLVLPMAGCEKIDGFWTWSGWTAVGVAVAIIGVIVARDRSGSVEQTAKGNDITQINNPGGGNVGDVNSPKTINIYNTTIQQISQNKSVPIEVLRSILASMGEKELDEAGPEKIEAILKAKADEYLQLNERLRHLGDSDPKVAEFKEKAAQTLQRGQFQEADDYLAQAEQLDRQAIKQQKTTIRKRCASAANTLAERADIARLQPNPASYRQAAEFFAQAADLVADSDAAQARSYQRQQASTLYDLGNECGQNAVLEEAVALYWQILSSTRRETEPLDWAGTQNNLGIALSILGERRGDEAQLQEAVTAYREALKEYTRERAPLQWAMTQNNLGNVFRALGDLRGDEAQLRESVTAYREALKERTRKRAPLDWAMTQNNLGAVLQTLGSRRGDEAQLQESVTAYRAALEVFSESSAAHYVQGIKRNLSRAEAALEQLKKLAQ
jgi:tetratricopeptide (TPR) repeat protein